MKSMLTPSAATSRATTPNDLGGDRPAQHHDGVGGRLAHHRQVVAALDRHVEADAVDGGLHLVAQFGTAGRSRPDRPPGRPASGGRG